MKPSVSLISFRVRQYGEKVGRQMIVYGDNCRQSIISQVDIGSSVMGSNNQLRDFLIKKSTEAIKIGEGLHHW